MTARFGFLLFPQVEELDFIGPWEMISIWRKFRDGPDVLTIAEHTGLIECSGSLKVQADYDFINYPALDYLLVPGGIGTRSEINNPLIIKFIQKQAQHCQTILSVCTGALLLQKAGLLAHKQATTHWNSIARLAEDPSLTVKQLRYIHDGNIWTSAGVSAGIDMILAFIAKTAGDEIAGSVQHFAEYYPDGKIYAEKFLPDYLK